VVVGNAISRGNPELEAVLERRVRYCSLPEAIRDFFLWGAAPVVLAGTHGKTTTTSLTGWLLTAGGLDPTVLSAAWPPISGRTGRATVWAPAATS
jgi:UDP-N-acetylmuramate: L-alanyl-gamma-D-glutamyl-meso-diaminopimelate ligase